MLSKADIDAINAAKASNRGDNNGKRALYSYLSTFHDSSPLHALYLSIGKDMGAPADDGDEIIEYKLKPHSSQLYTSSLSTFSTTHSALAPSSNEDTSNGSNNESSKTVDRPPMPLAYRNSFGGKINMKYRYVCMYVCMSARTYVISIAFSITYVHIYIHKCCS